MSRKYTEIPFNKPSIVGNEIEYIKQALSRGQLAGDGYFTNKCEEIIIKKTASVSAHLTHSCTAALEMAAILCELGPGDEVIMPSYTFVSTANAVVLRGAIPVFVDIDPKTLNICPEQTLKAFTEKTKAIYVVHYAGVVCDIDPILDFAKSNNVIVVEDAAQALGSKRNGQLAGSFGTLAAFSFHETKNVISGEGGVLVTTDPELTLRAEIIREKGTNRRQFFRGQVDKYSWVDIGSSFLPGELIASFLCAQLEQLDKINQRRLNIWQTYNSALSQLNVASLQLPFIPQNCEHNAHMYYMIMPSNEARSEFIDFLRTDKITAPFHYVPLHLSPFGRKHSRQHGSLEITEDLAARLVRLPMFHDLNEDSRAVIQTVIRYFE